MSLRRFAALFALFSLLAQGLLGCAIPVFTEPVTITTRHFESVRKHADEAPLVSGKSCSRVTLIFIPLGFGTANAAFDDALAKANGADTLVDWHMKQEVLAILGTIIYYQHCIVVEGKAIDSRELVVSAAEGEAAGQRYVEHFQNERVRAEAASRNQQLELARSGGGTIESSSRPLF